MSEVLSEIEVGTLQEPTPISDNVCQGETYTIEFNNPPGALGADDNPNNVLGYSYQWEVYENNIYVPAPGINDLVTYTTEVNNFTDEITKSYRCKVISNYCNNQVIWTAPVTVTFENTTDAGELNPVLNVCYGDTGELNFLTEPSGADTDNIFSYDDYTYLWEMASSSEGPWEEADGTNNQETYSTTTNSVVVETTTWYRCIVTSVDCGDVILQTQQM